MNLSEIDPDLIEPQRLAECVIDQLKVEGRKTPRTGPRITARDALRALWFEAQIIVLSANNVVNGMTLSGEDLERLAEAWNRIDRICREALH